MGEPAVDRNSDQIGSGWVGFDWNWEGGELEGISSESSDMWQDR